MPASAVSSRELVTVVPTTISRTRSSSWRGIRSERLAVTAEDERLVGVVSQADVARESKEKDTGEVVQSISRQPRLDPARPDLAIHRPRT